MTDTVPDVDAAPRRIEYMPLSQIQRAARNPKRHAEERIAASIDRFGLGEAPLLDERTGRLVAGHGRLDQLQARYESGQEPPDGITVTGDGDWLVPVQRGWRSRSDTDAEAYLVASNRIGEVGAWENRELAELLNDITSVDPDLAEVAGYNQLELEALLATFGDMPDLDDLADRVGDPTEEDSWVRVAFKVPPEIAQMWKDVTDATGEDNPTAAAISAVRAAYTQLVGTPGAY